MKRTIQKPSLQMFNLMEMIKASFLPKVENLAVGLCTWTTVNRRILYNWFGLESYTVASPNAIDKKNAEIKLAV